MGPMEGMSLKLTPVVVRHHLCPLSTYVWASGCNFLDLWLVQRLQTVLTESLTRLRMLTFSHQPSHPLSPAHPLIHTTHDITMDVKNIAQNPAVLAS